MVIGVTADRHRHQMALSEVKERTFKMVEEVSQFYFRSKLVVNVSSTKLFFLFKLIFKTHLIAGKCSHAWLHSQNIIGLLEKLFKLLRIKFSELMKIKLARPPRTSRHEYFNVICETTTASPNQSSERALF